MQSAAICDSAVQKVEVHAATFPPLDRETRAAVDTDCAAYHLNREPQTLRKWAAYQSGPILPLRINGRLAWPVAELRRLFDRGVSVMEHISQPLARALVHVPRRGRVREHPGDRRTWRRVRGTRVRCCCPIPSLGLSLHLDAMPDTVRLHEPDRFASESTAGREADRPRPLALRMSGVRWSEQVHVLHRRAR